MHKPKTFLKKKTHKIHWDFEIKTKYPILTRWLNLIVMDKKKWTCPLVDFPFLADRRLRELRLFWLQLYWNWQNSFESWRAQKTVIQISWKTTTDEKNYTQVTTLTDSMCQEKKKENNSPTMRTVQRFRDSLNIQKKSRKKTAAINSNIKRNNLRINRKVTNNKSRKQKEKEEQLYG